MTSKCPITGEIYFTPKNIDTELAKQLFTNCAESVKTLGKKLLASGWRIYVVTSRRGMCYTTHRVITIPAWAVKRELAYKQWYICHEMAHALVGAIHQHNHVFMEKLIEICPKESIHYELGYKPRNASAAGIQLPTDQFIESLGF